MVNYYHVLGLSENASPEEIKAAFKRLAVRYHPDKHPDRPEMEEKFKEINQAHQILSDPYEKARFDLKLKYQQFSHSQSRPYTYARSTPGYRPNPRYYRTKVDYRKNAIATAYAFGITFLIAIVVMSGVWAKKSYDDHLHEKEMISRRATFEDAKHKFDDGDYQEAFEMMSNLNFFYREEDDMKEFKSTMIDEIILKGSESYRDGNYQAAISLFELVQQFQPKNPFYEVKKKLADAYREIGDAQKAIDIWNGFLVSEYETIATLVKIAEINRDQLNDLNLALDHYIIAHRLAIKRYKTFYGEGYPLVINQKYVPKSHYDLYSGLADIYLRLDDTEMALKAADWNKYVWPDSSDAYITSGYAYLKLNDQINACNEFSEALKRGWTWDDELPCD